MNTLSWSHAFFTTIAFLSVLSFPALAQTGTPHGAAITTLEPAPPSIRVEKDITYLINNAAADEDKFNSCKLDLYLPANAAHSYPLLVWFHGGGLQEGSRQDDAGIARRFAESGVAFATADYRLSPKVKYPVYIEDAAKAVAWAVTEGVKRGATPGAIFVGGHSAGGYLAAMLAMDEKYLKAAGVAPESIAGYLPVSGQLITHSTVRHERGLSRATILADEASPLYHVRRDARPMLLLVGDKDVAGRLEETQLFTTAMTGIAKNKTTSMQVIANRSHVNIYTRLLTTGDAAGPAMLEFIQKWAKR